MEQTRERAILLSHWENKHSFRPGFIKPLMLANDESENIVGAVLSLNQKGSICKTLLEKTESIALQKRAFSNRNICQADSTLVSNVLLQRITVYWNGF